jgi:tetratricopeptide (TPR) repeat protein
VATVSDSDILAVSNDVSSQLQSTIRSQIIIYVVVFMCVGLALWLTMSALSTQIATPIHELRVMMESIAKGDLANSLNSSASSAEMHSILNAFSGMLVALRLGSESYAAGDITRAITTFREALVLYTRLGNERGTAIAHNNLAQALLRQNQLVDSELHNRFSVELGRKRLQDSDGVLLESATKVSAGDVVAGGGRGARGPDEVTVIGRHSAEHKVAPLGTASCDLRATVRKNKRVLSDRLGNLASLLLEQNRLNEALTVLDEGTRLDDECDNLRGLVVKRGIRGQVLQKQGHHDDAVRLFAGGLEFIAESMARFDPDDTGVGQQFYLLFIGSHFLNMRQPMEARWCFIQSLVRHPSCDVSALARAIVGLRATYEIGPSRLLDRKDSKEVSAIPGGLGHQVEAMEAPHMIRHITSVMARLRMQDTQPVGDGAKDLVFVLDYSGSMAGSDAHLCLSCLVLSLPSLPTLFVLCCLLLPDRCFPRPNR